MFNIGDLVTGIDRSYKRSIYKYIGPSEHPEHGMFEFVSLGRDCVEKWKDRGADKSQYTFPRRYEEFRLANEQEILESEAARATYCVRRILRKLEVTSS